MSPSVKWGQYYSPGGLSWGVITGACNRTWWVPSWDSYCASLSFSVFPSILSLPFSSTCPALLFLSSVGIVTTGKECTKSLPFCSLWGWTGKINWEQGDPWQWYGRVVYKEKRVNKPPVAETGQLWLRGKQPGWRHQMNQPGLKSPCRCRGPVCSQIQGCLVNAPQRRGESQGKMKSWLKTLRGQSRNCE